MFAIIVLCALLACTTALGAGVPHPWRLSDRFLGFRYELTPANHHEDVKLSIKDKADDLFCFGWVQDSPYSIVGEARCKISAGHELKSFLSSLVDGTDTNLIVFRDYPDTIIRLHFSNFKIVSPGRNTCFRDEPHKCQHLYFEAEDGTPFRDR